MSDHAEHCDLFLIQKWHEAWDRTPLNLCPPKPSDKCTCQPEKSPDQGAAGQPRREG